MNFRVRRVTGESESAILTVRGGRLLQSFDDLETGVKMREWDFPVVVFFWQPGLSLCARVELKKFRHRIANLGVSPNLCASNSRPQRKHDWWGLQLAAPQFFLGGLGFPPIC